MPLDEGEDALCIVAIEAGELDEVAVQQALVDVEQERLAARHARAKKLNVTLDFGEKQFRLTVRDDGAGFDPAKPPPTSGGFGLVGMKERAAELKGELCVRSKPDQGTEITLTVPLSGE